MTIREAINWLTSLAQRHGDKVPIYFDCPECKRCFEPDIVETSAIHVTAEKRDART